MTHIPNFAFVDCTNLVEVKFNEGLQTIGNGEFQKCSSLRRIDVPTSVIVIGNNSFYACTAWAEVELHEGLQTIRNYAFFKCR